METCSAQRVDRALIAGPSPHKQINELDEAPNHIGGGRMICEWAWMWVTPLRRISVPKKTAFGKTARPPRR